MNSAAAIDYTAKRETNFFNGNKNALYLHIDLCIWLRFWIQTEKNNFLTV